MPLLGPVALALLLAATPLRAEEGEKRGPGRGPSPTSATLQSLFVPGLGQIRSREPLHGLLFLGVESYLLTRVAIENNEAGDALDRAEETTGVESAYWQRSYELHRDRRGDFLFWTAITHMLNLVDAYVAAHLNGVEEEIDRVKTVTWRFEPTVDGGGDVSLSWTF
jgi:hypothetical protein